MANSPIDLVASAPLASALPTVARDGVLPTLFRHEVEAARRYAEASRSAATRRAYATDWRLFEAWAAARGFVSLPAEPDVVALFLAAEADRGLGPSGVGRRSAAIKYYHRRAGHEPPQARAGGAAIAEMLGGIRRSRTAPPKRKRPSDADMLRDMLKGIESDDLRALRDRALLALGMAGAFRRSELVALELADVAAGPEGLRLTIRRAKTDQESAGAVVAIPDGRRIRPVLLLERWLAAAGHADGPLFRRLTRGGRLTADPMSDRAVARLVQSCAVKAGYGAEDYAGHSLRSGFLTEAARQGASIFKMREVSRHKSMQVLSDYVRDAELFRDHAGEKFL